MNSSRSSLRNRNSRRSSRRRNKGSRNNQKVVLTPPPFLPTVCAGHKFRFNCGTNTGNFTITRGNLLNLMVVATTTTTVARIYTGIKLKRVQIWVNPPVVGDPSLQCSLEWVGENSPSVLHSDSTMGVRPAYISSKPPLDSSNRWWSMSGSQEADPLFSLSLPVGSVIDITTSIRFVDNEAAVNEGGIVGALVGTVYYNYLDGVTSGMLSPVGPVNILP